MCDDAWPHATCKSVSPPICCCTIRATLYQKLENVRNRLVSLIQLVWRLLTQPRRNFSMTCSVKQRFLGLAHRCPPLEWAATISSLESIAHDRMMLPTLAGATRMSDKSQWKAGNRGHKTQHSGFCLGQEHRAARTEREEREHIRRQCGLGCSSDRPTMLCNISDCSRI